MTHTNDQLDMFDTTTTTTTNYTPPAHIQPHEHGTHTGYRYGCRCQPCTKHHRDYAKAWSRGERICKNCGTN